MKCPNCGGQIFYEREITTNGNCTEGGAWQPILLGSFQMMGFICKNCGRVEIYCPGSPESFKKQEAAQKKAAEEEQTRQQRVEELNNRKKVLNAIVSDENQTVKAVREAKEELVRIDEELKVLNPKKGPCGNY